MKTQEQNPVDLRLKDLLTTAYTVSEPLDDLKRRIGAQMKIQLETAQRRARRWRRVRLGLAFAGAALFAFAVIAAIPRIAGAEDLYKLQRAIRDARSAHMVQWQVMPDGRHVKSEETWYQDGKWRMDNESLKVVTICNRGNRWTYQADENTVTLDRGTAPLGMEGMSGFSIGANVQDDALHGVIDDVRDIGSVIVNDRSARKILVRDNIYPTNRTLLTVDARTDLPLGLESQREIDGRWITERVTQEDFNAALPASTFMSDFPKTARLINQITGRAEWQRRLSQGIASEKVGEYTHTWRFDMKNGRPVYVDTFLVRQPRTVVLRDLQANSRGDVFALFTADTPVNREYIPASDMELTDNLGTRYIFQQDEPYAANFQELDGSFSGIAINNGENMMGMWWVPLEPIESWSPRRYTLTIRLTSYGEPERPKAVFHVSIEKPAVAYLPDYTPYMAGGFANSDVWVPIDEAVARAEYDQNVAHDLPAALTWYRRDIALQEKNVYLPPGAWLGDNQEWFAIYQIESQLRHPQEAKAALIRADQNNDYGGPVRDEIRAAMLKMGMQP